jgi:hypothetical protein
MKPSVSRSLISIRIFPIAAASLCVGLLTQGDYAIAQAPEAQSAVQQTTTTESDVPPISNDQLDSLVAPIALFPDPLLAQTLAASTYPLEIIQLQQWMERNKDLKDKALADAVAKQPWDPSVQALAAIPDVVQRLAGNIQWTTDLGNAFLAQQTDVMDAVQRMRGKAENKGTLKTSAQQVVETKTVESGKQVIEIQSAQPDVVYVPSYDPVVVYGAPAYPYYPYTYPGYYPGMGLAWGAAGFALGAWAGGYWGNCNWNNGNITINNKNNFNKNNWNNINSRPGNRPGAGNRPSQLPTNGGNWNHNPKHRGNAPYDRRGQEKYGNRGQGNRGQGNLPGSANRPGGGGAGIAGGNRPSQLPAAGGNRPGAGNSNRPGGGASNVAGNRPGKGPGDSRPSGSTGTRPGSGSAARPGSGTRPSTKPSQLPANSRGGDRVGDRSVASGRNPGGNSGFSGSRGGGYNGGSARASSNRGGRSMGGGGMSRGGGRGGGRR